MRVMRKTPMESHRHMYIIRVSLPVADYAIALLLHLIECSKSRICSNEPTISTKTVATK